MPSRSCFDQVTYCNAATSRVATLIDWVMKLLDGCDCQAVRDFDFECGSGELSASLDCYDRCVASIVGGTAIRDMQLICKRTCD